jgi:hypothetical protein
MRRSVYCAALVAFGMLAVLSSQARSQDSSRETIIQGVRDDVRRKIREGSERASNPSTPHIAHEWHHPMSPRGH